VSNQKVNISLIAEAQKYSKKSGIANRPFWPHRKGTIKESRCLEKDFLETLGCFEIGTTIVGVKSSL